MDHEEMKKVLREADGGWRADFLSSSEVWAVRELISVLKGAPDSSEDPSHTPDDRKGIFLIHKCEKNGVDIERCRRLLDILDLDSDVLDERLDRYRKAV